MKKTNNEKRLDVVFLLDNSGSMDGSEEHTISSFNEYLEREKNNKYSTFITTILFNHTYRYLHKNINVIDVDNITNEDYYVGGTTALYDALGSAIKNIERQNTSKVMFIIITDGYENSSVKYNKEQIKKMINKHDDWQFLYIGADIDSYASGSEIGIRKENIANYKKDKKATSLLFRSVGNVEKCMMCEEEINSSWKEDLEDYLKNNN